HDTQIEFARLDGVDVEHRAAGGFYGAAQPVIGTVFVDQAANSTAGRIVNAGYATGTNTDKLLLRRGRNRRRQSRQHCGGAGRHGKTLRCECFAEKLTHYLFSLGFPLNTPACTRSEHVTIVLAHVYVIISGRTRVAVSAVFIMVSTIRGETIAQLPRESPTCRRPARQPDMSASAI